MTPQAPTSDPTKPDLPIDNLMSRHEFQEIFLGDHIDPATSKRYFHAEYPKSPQTTIDVHQEDVIRQLIAEVKYTVRSGAPREFWIANVPSSDEACGHHSAFDQRSPTNPNDPKGPSSKPWVEPEYRARLRHAYMLLATGIVRYVFISGGQVDPRPASKDWWNSAMFGWKEMVDTYSEHWRSRPLSVRDGLAGPHDRLESRLIVDPWALHSETNVRNCARLCALLGLDRTLITTTGGCCGQGALFADTCGPNFMDVFLACDCCKTVLHQSFGGSCKRKYGAHLGDFKILDGACPTGVHDKDGIFGTGLREFRGVRALQPIPDYQTVVILQSKIPQALLLSGSETLPGWPPSDHGSQPWLQPNGVTPRVFPPNSGWSGGDAPGWWNHVDNIA
jgi:hypothetical protein